MRQGRCLPERGHAGALRFRTAAGFRIVAAHDRRHLWQARRVLESLGFPAR